METRSNYTLTGLFVVVFLAAAIALGLWIAGDLHRGDVTRYTVKLDESVSGLNENSRVLLQGVPVGRLVALSIDPDNPQRVRATLELDAAAPVRRDTEAVLRTQGATGLMRLELEGGSADAPPPEQPEGEPYPIIQYKPSFWARVDSSVDEGLVAIDTAARQLTELLSDKNVEAFSEILGGLELFSQTLARNSDEVDRILSGAAGMVEAGEMLAKDLPQSMERLDSALEGIERLTRTFDVAGEEVITMARSGQGTMDAFSRQTLPNLNALIRELEALSQSMRQLSDELSEQPEMLIFGSPEIKPGPGEK